MRETLDLIQMICKVRRCGVFASGIVLSQNRKATSGRQPVKNYLLTYTLVQDATRVTRRATIWRRSANTWKIVYHQGTVVENE